MREDCGILVISPQGRLLASTPLAELLLGCPLPKDTLLGVDHSLFRCLADVGHSREEILSCESEEHCLMKGDMLPENGVWFTSFPLCDENNEVTGTVVTLVKREVEKADQVLKFLGISCQNLMDMLPEGAFMINTRWQINYFNETAELITGFKRREVLGKFCWEVFRSDMCRHNCPMRVSMNTSEVLLDQEVEILCKCNKPKLLIVNTSQVKRGGDKVLGGLQTFHESGCHQAPQDVPSFDDIIAGSSKMKDIIHRLPIVAASDSNVLIQGDSGTGKELVAKAIHLHSHRRKGPFLVVNCSAIPDNLLESELFGHERGAFTGAVACKPGRFELARGGTLFLDEIGDLQPHLQVKLLRVLENRSFERVGGTREISLDARIIAATNVDLMEAVRQGRFREDLYYRLFTVPIYLPPLRERRSDIPVLVDYFVDKMNRKFSKQVRGVDTKVMASFYRHSWPGNVRELQHTIEHCFVFVRGAVIMERHLPRFETFDVKRSLGDDGESPLRVLERKTILTALKTANWNKQEAAKLLQISRSKLWRKMKAYSIAASDFRSEHM